MRQIIVGPPWLLEHSRSLSGGFTVSKWACSFQQLAQSLQNKRQSFPQRDFLVLS